MSQDTKSDPNATTNIHDGNDEPAAVVWPVKEERCYTLRWKTADGTESRAAFTSRRSAARFRTAVVEALTAGKPVPIVEASGITTAKQAASASARKAAAARWAKATPEERSANGRRAVEARWGKKGGE